MRKPPTVVYVGLGFGFQALVYSGLPLLAARRDRRVGWRGGRPGSPNLLGFALVAAGTTFVLWAVLGHHRAAPDDVRVTARPEYLAEGGAYAVSRNPLYVGGLAIFFGWATVLGSRRAAAAGAALLTGLATVGVPFEERMLRRRFGDSYADYTARVPRWLGSPRGTVASTAAAAASAAQA